MGMCEESWWATADLQRVECAAPAGYCRTCRAHLGWWGWDTIALRISGKLRMVSRAGHVCAFNLGGGAHSSAEPASLGARLKRAGEGIGRASSNGFWHTLPPATADPNSIPELVTYGCDTFDSCYPTRAGRHGTMLTPDGPLRVVSGGWCVRSGHTVCTAPVHCTFRRRAALRTHPVRAFFQAR